MIDRNKLLNNCSICEKFIIENEIPKCKECEDSIIILSISENKICPLGKW